MSRRNWPHPGILPIVQPLVEAVANAIHRSHNGRRWSWPASSPIDCAQAIEWRHRNGWAA